MFLKTSYSCSSFSYYMILQTPLNYEECIVCKTYLQCYAPCLDVNLFACLKERGIVVRALHQFMIGEPGCGKAHSVVHFFGCEPER